MGARFTLFADCLYTGVLLTIAALPVVTAFAAVTSAAALLRERVSTDRPVSARALFGGTFAVLRRSPLLLLGPPLLLVVLLVDVVAVRAGMPGAWLWTPVVAVALGGGATVGLRAAVAWTPTSRWRELLPAAAAASIADLPGSLLLLAAIATAVVIGTLAVVVAPLAAGLVVFAAVVVVLR